MVVEGCVCCDCVDFVVVCGNCCIDLCVDCLLCFVRNMLVCGVFFFVWMCLLVWLLNVMGNCIGYGWKEVGCVEYVE